MDVKFPLLKLNACIPADVPWFATYNILVNGFAAIADGCVPTPIVLVALVKPLITVTLLVDAFAT